MRRLAFFAAGMLWACSALAFANVPVGATVENVSLPTLAGDEQFFLSETRVTVFIFIKPGLEHSNQALIQLGRLQREMTNQPVHWCAVVSDRVPKAEVEAEIQETGVQMPVLIDRGDLLYGRLGVILHPVIGITDKDRKLLAYEPFAKVNYANVVRAQIRHALKEISDEELAEVLHPAALPLGGVASEAHRYLRLAEKQFQNTNYTMAMTNTLHSIDKNPTTEAHVLQGRILLAQGNRAAARSAFEAALKLDPRDANALEGLKSCQGAAR